MLAYAADATDAALPRFVVLPPAVAGVRLEHAFFAPALPPFVVPPPAVAGARLEHASSAPPHPERPAAPTDSGCWATVRHVGRRTVVYAHVVACLLLLVVFLWGVMQLLGASSTRAGLDSGWLGPLAR